MSNFIKFIDFSPFPLVAVICMERGAADFKVFGSRPANGLPGFPGRPWPTQAKALDCHQTTKDPLRHTGHDSRRHDAPTASRRHDSRRHDATTGSPCHDSRLHDATTVNDSHDSRLSAATTTTATPRSKIHDHDCAKSLINFPGPPSLEITSNYWKLIFKNIK